MPALADATRVVRLLALGSQASTWITFLEPFLRSAGFEISCSTAGRPWNVICASTTSPELLSTVHRLRQQGTEHILVLMMDETGHSHDTLMSLVQAGAEDILPLSEPRGATANHVAAKLARWATVDAQVHAILRDGRVTGSAPRWRATLREIVEISLFGSGPLLLTGETGTGKEMVARLVHELDPRPDKGDFVVLDCTTVVADLAGSEFFGHERGAFTGALAARSGAFALADGGTLFLDEVGELPLGLQAQLLRVIQEHTFKPVGGNTWQRTEFRLISATHRDLLDQARNGRFRSDLYYRLASHMCFLPPLRERREDIPDLVRHFWCESHPNDGPPDLAMTVSNYLVHRDYPGNVRDLKQLVTRMACRHAAGPITIGSLPRDEIHSLPASASSATESLGAPGLDEAVHAAVRAGIGLKEISRRAAEAAMRAAIDLENGNLQRAARMLGVTDRALQLRRAAARRDPLDASNEDES